MAKCNQLTPLPFKGLSMNCSESDGEVCDLVICRDDCRNQYSSE